MRITNDTKDKLKMIKFQNRLISLEAAILHLMEENERLKKNNKWLRENSRTNVFNSTFEV